jgi:ankyrin repeat protein
MDPIFDHIKFGKYSEVHKYILSGNSVNATNNGLSLLTNAIHRNHFNIAKLLIDYGAELINNNISNSPIHVAAKCGRKKIFRYICSLNLLNVNSLRHNYESMLLYIVRRGKLHMYETLMSAGAINNEILILYHMIYRHHIFGKFINKHIDINKVDANGNNVLHYLANDSPWHHKRYCKNIIAFAISLGADIRHKNNGGNCPINNGCIIQGHLDGICELIFDIDNICYLPKVKHILFEDAIKTNNIEKCKLIMSIYGKIVRIDTLHSLFHNSTLEVWKLLLPKCDEIVLCDAIVVYNLYMARNVCEKLRLLQSIYPEFLSEKGKYIDELLANPNIYTFIDKLNVYPFNINQHIKVYRCAWKDKYNKLIILLSDYRTRYLQNSIGGYFKCLPRDIIRHVLVLYFTE